MSVRRCVGISLLPLLLLLFTAAGCRPPGDGAVACGQLEPRNDDEVALCNDLDQAVIASVAYPAGDPPPEGWPGVVVLHGSGGLYFTNDDKSCSEELQDAFRTWAELLTERGYAVVMPASFYSRGFCDWHETYTVPRELDDDERLVVRTFDAAAAANYLCDDPRVDCSRLAALGFSNGGSTLLMLYHDDHRDAVDERLRELDGLPPFVGGVAYYPGCGLRKQLATSLDQTDTGRFYYPRAPVFMPHGSKDDLLDGCEGLRDPQVDTIADQRGVIQDMFEIEVYGGAKHGFDDPDKREPQANADARADAQAKTLAKLDAWF